MSGSLSDSYLADLADRIAGLRGTAAMSLDRAAEAMTACIQRDGLIYIFGSGHSHMLAEEAHFRAGGLAATVPMLAAATMLHEAASVGTKLERLPGLVPALLARYPVGPKDVMIVVSTSGVNAAPVEAAMFGRTRGATVIAITSESYSQAAANGRPRIADLADIVLDNGAPPGDATQDARADGRSGVHCDRGGVAECGAGGNRAAADRGRRTGPDLCLGQYARCGRPQ
jgi:uncharacterized phosphosugar-binding protein